MVGVLMSSFHPCYKLPFCSLLRGAAGRAEAAERAQAASRAAVVPIIYERRRFFIVRAASCEQSRELSVEGLAAVRIAG